jgi:hypothetical protein
MTNPKNRNRIPEVRGRKFEKAEVGVLGNQKLSWIIFSLGHLFSNDLKSGIQKPKTGGLKKQSLEAWEIDDLKSVTKGPSPCHSRVMQRPNYETEVRDR